MKKKFTKKTPNFEISQDLNKLLKKYNIDKAKYYYERAAIYKDMEDYDALEQRYEDVYK